MTDDAIIESIRAICAPLPECEKLRDRIIEALKIRFEESNVRDKM
jgi:hypothetical protein